MKISLIQLNTGSDKPLNIETAIHFAEQAIEADRPDLVIFPEHFDFAGGTAQLKIEAAESFNGGQAWAACSRLASKHKVNVLSGSFLEKVPGEDRVYNTSVMFDRSGDETARYRKIHMFDITAPDGLEYRESATVKPGDETVVVAVDGVNVGLAICYDLRFPELFAALVKKGAELILLPAAFTLQTGKDHWEVLCRARAIETQCYFAACGSCGVAWHDGHPRACYGHSLLVDPWGHVIAQASDGERFVTGRIDKEVVEKVRQQIPLQHHRVL